MTALSFKQESVMRSPRKPFRELVRLVNDTDFEFKAFGIQMKGRGILGTVIPSVIAVVILLIL